MLVNKVLVHVCMFAFTVQVVHVSVHGVYMHLYTCSCYQEYIRRGKESVVLRIAACKRTLKSAKVKLRNTTQNLPQTSSAVTASTRVRGCAIACTHARNDGTPVHVCVVIA